jgi:hypothetical protein
MLFGLKLLPIAEVKRLTAHQPDQPRKSKFWGVFFVPYQHSYILTRRVANDMDSADFTSPETD